MAATLFEADLIISMRFMLKSNGDVYAVVFHERLEVVVDIQRPPGYTASSTTDDYLPGLVVIGIFKNGSRLVKGGLCKEFIRHLDSSFTLRL